jgi:hypothetical protein
VSAGAQVAETPAKTGAPANGNEDAGEQTDSELQCVN